MQPFTALRQVNQVARMEGGMHSAPGGDRRVTLTRCLSRATGFLKYNMSNSHTHSCCCEPQGSGYGE